MATSNKKEVVNRKPPRSKKKQESKQRPGPDGKLDLILSKLELISDWLSDGASHDIIAHKLGISRSTWFKHKAENELISDCVRAGEQIAAGKVQSALFRKAIGEKKEEITITSGGDKPTQVKKVIKEIQGDFNAQKFWLVNRDKDNWKNVQTEAATSGDEVVIVEDVPKD
jgi:hypothetical protein